MSMKEEDHLVYSCRYHIAFCPKYRRPVLMGDREYRLREILHDIAEKKGFQICETEIMPDYVHLIIDCSPRYGVLRCISDLKMESASIMRKEFPELKRRLPCMWNRYAFVATVGTYDMMDLCRFYENQKGK